MWPPSIVCGVMSSAVHSMELQQHGHTRSCGGIGGGALPLSLHQHACMACVGGV